MASVLPRHSHPTASQLSPDGSCHLPRKVGLILPSGNQVAEPQLQAMFAGHLSLHTTRLKLTSSAEEELLRMTDRVEEAALLLADACVDLILFHCTAVSTYSPNLEQEILTRISAVTGIQVCATSKAIVAGLQELGAHKLVLLSPYVERVNLAEAHFLENAGFQPIHVAGLGIEDAKSMSEVSPRLWKEFVLSNQRDDADAYLVSCTTVRAAEVAADIEAALGKPVVTSNSTAARHCLRLLKTGARIPGFGQLLSMQHRDSP